MKNSRHNKLIIKSLFFAILTGILWLCLAQTSGYNHTRGNKNKELSNTSVDFNLINQLNESNQKTIEITSYIFNHSQDVQTLRMILKIKHDHEKIDLDIKKITEKNLILIPKLDYYLNFEADFVKLKKSNSNLLAALETELINQIVIFNQIKTSTHNSDFKIFAKQSIPTITTNIDLLKNF